MDDELEKMMQDALNEVEGLDNDTTDDESEQEESASTTDDGGEDQDFEQHDEEDESSLDQEDEYIDEDEDTENSEGEHVDGSDDQDIDSKESSQDFEPIEVEVSGQKISIDSKEEMLAFIKKSANSMGSKRQRKSKNDQIVEQGNLSEDDLALLIDAKNGDPQAIAKLAKDSNIDVYDLSDDGKYDRKFNPQFMSEADEVAEDILADTELATTFKEVVSSLPPEFTSAIATDAKALKHFSGHVKSGLAQRILPQALKAQLLNGGTLLDHYATIGREMSKQESQPKEDSKEKRVKNPRADNLRKRAKNNKGSNKGSKTKVTGNDIWDMSDKDFDAQYGA